MKIADLPKRFPKAWGASAGGGYIRSIPTDSQIGVHDGWASLTDGFPPLNFQPVDSGGIPPFGADHNGILNWLTLQDRWSQSGGPATYDATFATSIGGYPKGAVLASALLQGLQWISRIDDNMTNPEGAFSNDWLSIGRQSLGLTGAATLTTQHNDAYILAYSGSGYTITLPAPSVSNGVRYHMRNTTGTSLTIHTPSGVIWGTNGNGTSSASFPSDLRMLEVWSDGGNWFIAALAAFDTTDAFRIPNDLYGRDLRASRDVLVTRNITAGGTLDVTGNATVHATLTVNVDAGVTRDAFIGRNLGVSGFANISGYGQLGSGAYGSGDGTRIVRLADFASGVASPAQQGSWWRAPDGMICQMVSWPCNFSNGVWTTTLLPMITTFPTACYGAVGSYASGAGTGPPGGAGLNTTLNVDVYDTSRCRADIFGHGASGTVLVRAYAWGR